MGDRLFDTRSADSSKYETRPVIFDRARAVLRAHAVSAMGSPRGKTKGRGVWRRSFVFPLLWC
jgi:hypothetical protein